MKKITLSAIIIMASIFSVQAQLYTPSGTVLGTSLNSNVGIGTSSPSEKITIEGNHGDTRFLLHSIGGGDDARQADLMLWASEPQLT
ncbi:hypothetical protein OIU83_11305 [Flavobacterium sp. LS1R49]|uniref:Secretion protein n=1 Tax=Flavobacterium shii TaxID=2987687 RepID=A0A9X2ZBJ7_9FLAO|nr:hypothetical protein [Flavobacterium shii]MCV9928246.1 hypothetical protein [Flavobacterium shii]